MGAGADADRARRGRGPRRRARHGADDYLVKPFAFAELLAGCARWRAAARPSGRACSRSATSGSTRRRARCARPERDPLSAKEFALLETFMRRPGEVLSRFDLLEHAWDFAYENRSNVVDVYIRRLRRKIDEPFGRARWRRCAAPATGCAPRRRHEPSARSACAWRPPSRSRWRSCWPARACSSTCASTPTSPRRSTRICGCARRTSRARPPPRSSLAATRRPLHRARRELRPAARRRDGRVLDATPPLGVAARCSPATSCGRGDAGPIYVDRAPVPGLDERSRLLATPVRRAGHGSCSSSARRGRTGPRHSPASATSC